MELRHLRYFVAVAQEQSFTRAALKLRVAQPPLSRQIQQFEEELGVVLIDRASRPSKLTDAGRVMFEQAVQILDRVDELKRIARQMASGHQRRFSIGFVPSTLYGYLPDILREFQAVRPETELSMTELTSLEQIAALKDGRIDVGFGRIPFENTDIVRQLLRNERMIAAYPSGHAQLDQPGSLKLEALTDDPLIVYPKSPRPSYADQVIALFRNRGLQPHSLVEVRELQTALGLVAAKLGVCLVPASVRRLQRNGVSYRALDEKDAISPIIMSYRRRDQSAELVVIREVIQSIYLREGLVFGGA